MQATSNIHHGRAVIPAALREQLGLHDGDQLIWQVRDGELVATTRRAQLHRAQQRFQQTVAKDSPSLSEELAADRRRAADTE
ncbi:MULTISPECIES: AbrB/MazE/SpoVT family DNA-binding domain-containing protein [Pseudacidovorax]|uniref:AbrB family looped-hinge helix DNA binding protein n=1 Tax=Pseudacidovorax intermedius TaxID=433924 RepID=A0A370FBR5_9BURK|nr:MULTISPECIES: AbrB/MazE/SpoVT family DNA-binding domain-containing protein [Pseudacidovorax]MBO9644410.1 AbrB/MazE/SpoVT family DNA-binding domain-containing protein [Pseudacidovorax sp.]RDI21218.1 AbrB family looped-hinge helix DNA binding protein [Pseudacidovorax intermedius]